MKRALVLALLLVPATARAADERTAVNAVYFEALGNGLLYSVNYERLFPELQLGVRGGVSYAVVPVDDKDGSGKLKIASFPVVASYYLFGPRHFLQLGLGATLLYVGASTDTLGQRYESEGAGLGIAGTGVIGYRFLSPTPGFDFGIGFTPLVRSTGFLPWGGIHAGGVF